MQIYYINLARRADRRTFMEDQFSRLGLAATRIEAVTPDELSAEDLDRWCNPARGRWHTPPELCCSLSHLKATRTLQASEHPYALVLEDDAVLSASLPRFLLAYDAESPPYDLVRIETSLERLRLKRGAGPDIGGVAICSSYSPTAGAAGYVVSRRAAGLASAGREMWLKPPDQVFFNPYEPLPRRLVVRQTDPGLCIQTYLLEATGLPDLPSDLVGRNARAVAEAPHFWRRLPHVIAVALERDVVVGAQKAWHQYVGGARKRRIEFHPG